jgi:beta-glucosidase
MLTDLLKNELGFNGLVIIDWRDINSCYYLDHVAISIKEAVKLAINVIIDISLNPNENSFIEYLYELVNEGEVSIEAIDDAVRRIIRVKFKVGLFYQPYTNLEDY